MKYVPFPPNTYVVKFGLGETRHFGKFSVDSHVELYCVYQLANVDDCSCGFTICNCLTLIVILTKSALFCDVEFAWTLLEYCLEIL